MKMENRCTCKDENKTKLETERLQNQRLTQLTQFSLSIHNNIGFIESYCITSFLIYINHPANLEMSKLAWHWLSNLVRMKQKYL